MVGGPVDFVGDYSLNFAWIGRKKMFQLLGVRTHVEFINKLNAPKGTTEDTYEKIVYSGLFAKHPSLKLERGENDAEGSVYVEDIIEQYFLSGHDQRDFDDIIIDAFVEAGLMNREQITFSRKKRKIKSRDDIKKLLDLLDKTFADAEATATNTTESETATSENQGDDTGEPLGNSPPTLTT